MVARLWVGLITACWLLLPGVAYGQEPGQHTQNIHLSVRAFGLSIHLFDVSADAPYYPLKLDDNATAVLNTGLALSLDLPTHFQYLPFVRLAVAGYADCAQQPAGYAGLIAMLPEASWRHFTFMGGAGIGLAARRNWKHHVDPHHTSSTFQDWGTLEGMWGLYGELDFLFHNEARTHEFVLSLIPGFPHILVFSVGMRWGIGE